jgi:hypothetical protein
MSVMKEAEGFGLYVMGLELFAMYKCMTQIGLPIKYIEIQFLGYIYTSTKLL